MKKEIKFDQAFKGKGTFTKEEWEEYLKEIFHSCINRLKERKSLHRVEFLYIYNVKENEDETLEVTCEVKFTMEGMCLYGCPPYCKFYRLISRVGISRLAHGFP